MPILSVINRLNLDELLVNPDNVIWYPLMAVLLGILFVAGTVIIWNMALRRKVAEKTSALSNELNERKRIEETLKKSQVRLITLMNSLPGMAYRHLILSEDFWPFEFTSEGCYELTRYKSLCGPEHQTTYADKIIHPEDRELMRRKIKQALKNREPFRLIYRIFTAGGHPKWVWEQGVGTYHEDGTIACVEGFITDITTYKEAEESLSRSRRLFEDLVVNSLVGIAIIHNGQIVYQNPEQKRLFGPLPQDFNLFEFKNIYPEDVQNVRHFFSRVVEGHKNCPEADFRMFAYSEDGTDSDRRWVHCRAALIEYQGKPSILLNMIDVSRAKELEHIVSVHDKMSSLGRVAAGIAHEIRNPLSGINIYLGALERLSIRSTDASQYRGIIDQIKTASHDIETVIRRVMDFAKPGVPNFASLNINQPIRDAIGLCAVTLRKNQIALTQNLSDQELPCFADSNFFQRVIMNLINNATEAMKNMEGGKQLEIASGVVHDKIVVRVSDSGPGIPSGIRERIFDPFYTTKNDGTGIGLSLSQRIIMDHNGALTAGESRWGGAEFTIELPLAKGSLHK
jgi:PAS domain S-box-containing protein